MKEERERLRVAKEKELEKLSPVSPISPARSITKAGQEDGGHELTGDLHSSTSDEGILSKELSSEECLLAQEGESPHRGHLKAQESEE